MYRLFNKKVYMLLAGILLLYMSNVVFQVLKFEIDFLSVEVIAIELFVACAMCGLFYFSDRINVYTITFVSAMLYFVWGLFAEVTPFVDYLHFYSCATRFAGSFSLEILHETKSPVSILYNSFFMLIFGKNLISIYLANAVIWALQIPLLYYMLKNFGFSEKPAKFSSILYGLYPGTIFFAPLISSEALFMFFFILSFYLISRLHKDNDNRYLPLLGLSLALAYLSRDTAIIIIAPAFLWLALLISKKLLEPKFILIALAMFLLPLALQAGLNYKFEKRLSPSASPFIFYNFMMGTNQKFNGGHNIEDYTYFMQEVEKSSWREASAKAFNVAKQRILNDPFNFAVFAVTNKMENLWYGGDYQTIYLTNSRLEREKTNPIVHKIAVTSVRAFYLIIILGAFVSLAISLYRVKSAFFTSAYIFEILSISSMLIMSVLLIFFEVQPRYHLPYMPFFMIYLGQLLDFLYNKFQKEPVEGMA